MVFMAVPCRGRIGRMPAAGLAAHPRAAPAGVCDVHEPSANAAAGEFGARRLPGGEEIRAPERVDDVPIATPAPTRVEPVETGVRARQAVCGRDRRVGLPGSKGMVIPENPIENPVSRHVAGATGIRSPLPNVFIERTRRAFDSETGPFVGAVAEGKPVPVGFEDGRLALVVADACIRSAADGRTVHVSELE